MAADSLGNDVSAVAVPVTGFLATAPGNTTLITPSAGAASNFSLSSGTWSKVGLLKEDGGFTWTLEPDGDPIVFWQDGYQIPSGLANATLVATLAETNPIVRKLITGKTPDANGYVTIDAGGHADDYALFTEEIFKNRVIRRRQAIANVTAVAEDQSTRGEVLGYEVTFTVKRSPALNNEHIGEWLIQPS